MTAFERIGAQLGRFVVRFPQLTIVASLLCVALGSLGLINAKFSTDYRIFFGKEDPGLQSFEKLESVFTQTDNVLFVVHSPMSVVFHADALQALKELTEAGWKLPFAARVDSLTNFPYLSGDGEELVMAQLLDSAPEQLDSAALADLLVRADSEPMLKGSLLSNDYRTAGVNVTLRLPRRDPLEVKDVVAQARAVVADVKTRHPSLDIRVTGMAFVNHAFMETSLKDMSVMIPLMLVVMLVTLSLLLRSTWATLAVAAVIAFSALLSMSLAGWLNYPLSPTSIAAPMMVLTVAIADGVHIVLQAREGLQRGLSKSDAIVEALSHTLEAVTYTWLTTVVGFLCLNTSDAPPVTHLANMSSVGVTCAYLLSIVLLPACLAVMPMKPSVHPTASSLRRFGKMSEWVTMHRRAVLAGSLVVTVVFAGLASRLETNDAFIQYFDRSLQFRQDIDFAMEKLSGIYRLEFQLGAGGPGQIAEPAYLERLHAFSEWLKEQPEVQHVYGLHMILSRVHQVLHGGERRLPTEREEASEELLLYTLQLPAGVDLTDRINIDQSSSRLTVTVRDLSTKAMGAFVERAENWLKTEAPAYMVSRATGPVAIFSAMSDRNARSMVQGDFGSLLLISICMVLVLKSLRLGILSVIPNVIPIVVGYGIWYLAVGRLNIVGTIAGSISLGIIVDDTIHFLTRFRALHGNGVRPAESAMRLTVEQVGPAMIVTSVVLALGFGVLTLSKFQMTSHLGWLCGLIVGVAPLADLVVAPALVLTFANRKKSAAQSESFSALAEKGSSSCVEA